MDQNERITSVETKMDYVSADIKEIKKMLSDHIARDGEKLTREEAYKAFAYKHIEPEIDKLRSKMDKGMWIIISSGVSMVISLIIIIVKTFIR